MSSDLILDFRNQRTVLLRDAPLRLDARTAVLRVQLGGWWCGVMWCMACGGTKKEMRTISVYV